MKEGLKKIIRGAEVAGAVALGFAANAQEKPKTAEEVFSQDNKKVETQVGIEQSKEVSADSMEELNKLKLENDSLRIEIKKLESKVPEIIERKRNEKSEEIFGKDCGYFEDNYGEEYFLDGLPEILPLPKSFVIVENNKNMTEEKIVSGHTPFLKDEAFGLASKIYKEGGTGLVWFKSESGYLYFISIHHGFARVISFSPKSKDFESAPCYFSN